MASRKYTTKHPERNPSNYCKRLAKRGLRGSQVTMRTLAELRRIQERRKEETGVPWFTVASANEQSDVA